MRASEPTPTFKEPDYEYGNRSPIHVIKIVPNLASVTLDPHASLQNYELKDKDPYTDKQLRDTLTEIADNYQVVFDPASTESEPKQIGMTIANKDLLLQGVPGIFIMTTAGSSLYDEERNPNNAGIAIEMAYEALTNRRPIILGESPGTGNSSDLTKDEYRQAVQDGKLVHEVRDHTGKIISYEDRKSVV
jgi:hypothetical protein